MQLAGAVLLDAGLEVLGLSLEVVEVEAVADGRDERHAVAARHLPRHQGALVAACHAAPVRLALLLAGLVWISGSRALDADKIGARRLCLCVADAGRGWAYK